MNLDSYVSGTINWYLENLGTLVSDEHYEARLEICKKCPSYGKVNVAGNIMDGCTECGCPSSTKPRAKEYFNPRQFKKITVKCPLDKWAETDLLFNQKF